MPRRRSSRRRSSAPPCSPLTESESGRPSTIGRGFGNRIETLGELRFPDSLGLLYSTITTHCGFEVNDGEYKLMGLAPYGEPRYVEGLTEHVVAVRDDGSIRLNQRYFGFRTGERMGSRRLDELLDGPPRALGAPPRQREADLARSIQVITEDAMVKMARHARRLTDERNLCLAGGVALNCVANQRIIDDGCFDEVWVQPAAGDGGAAVGAALWTWHETLDRPTLRPAVRWYGRSVPWSRIRRRGDHGLARRCGR